MVADRSLRGRARLSKYKLGYGRSDGMYPLLAVHLIGRYLRLFSVYFVYRYLAVPGSSVVIFTFLCMTTAAIMFLVIHRPWRGRLLTTYQLVPTIINGAFLSLACVFWGLGLQACDPLRTIMAEYVGAVLGALSTLILGRGGEKWKKVAGLVAMLASYVFLSQGWAMITYSPFSFRINAKTDANAIAKESIGLNSMSFALLGGVFAGLCRVIARRVSLKTQMKRRLHVITVAAAACYLFPIAVFEATQKRVKTEGETPVVAIWAFICNTVLGIVLPFYMDTIAEERLQIFFGSPRHLLVTSGCICILEIMYGIDFSLLGFLICASLLGLGIFEAAPLERSQGESQQLPMQADNFDASQGQLVMSPVISER